MRRGLLVLTALLLAAGVSWADYVVIRINLVAGEGSSPDQLGPVGYPGYPGGPAGAYPGAGPTGGRPPGYPAPGRPGGTPEGSGPRPGGPGAGYPGAPGNPRGPKSGDTGFDPETGSPDGSGSRGGRGPRFPAPMAPVSPDGMTPPQESEEFTYSFVAVVDADHASGQSLLEVRHKWSPRNIRLPKEIPGRVEVRVDKFPSLSTRLQQERTRLLELESGKELSVAGMLRLADWMLQHWNLATDQDRFEMRRELEDLIDKLAKADAQHARVKALVAARANVQKSLDTPAADVTELRAIIPNSEDLVDTKSGHYVVLHHGRDAAAASRRLKRLEHLYAGYFYWFALRGEPVPAPERKLLCVLAQDFRNFQTIHAIFDSLPVVADGFFSRIDKVAVFAPTRIDEPYLRLQAMITTLERQGFDMQKIVRGEPLPKDTQERFKEKPDELLYANALALARQAALEEGEVATISNEGVHQLAAVTGVLPGRVHLPEAVRFGLSSFFETPKSDGQLMFVSYWSGIGGPSWVYLPWFKKIIQHEGKEMSVKDALGLPEEHKIKVEKVSLAKVLTDQRLRDAARTNRLDRGVAITMARAEQWALTYFLAREKLDSLLKFYKELSKLPRDIDLSDEVVLRAFGTAFGLLDQPGNIDAKKMAALEGEWRDFMNQRTLRLVAEGFKKPKEKEKPKNQ